jgi:hypothetical protein
MASPLTELAGHQAGQGASRPILPNGPRYPRIVQAWLWLKKPTWFLDRDGSPPGHPASAEEIQAGPGHGIVGMRERITAFCGWLHADPLAEGRGFRVTAQGPIEGAV